MKTGRCEHTALSDDAVILNFIQIVVLSLTLFMACCCIATVHAQTDPYRTPEVDAAIAPKLEELLTTVYCYCGCTRETIEVCVCETAVMIEKDFRARLLAGQTVEQIRTNYLDTFGPQYYAVMPAEGINLIAYIMPAVILVLIGGVAFVVLRKSKQEAVVSNRFEDSKQQVSDTTVKRVEVELEQYKRQN